MKCLQCGTELDRLSKWRSSSEYCSEECKKASQEEFNRLAMSRLMQLRPARTNTRSVANAVRNVETSAGPVTVVTHPVGASAPVVTEPPEASFLLDVLAALSTSQAVSQTPLEPRPALPLIPEPDLAVADSLMALESILRGMRPSRRGARELPPITAKAYAYAQPVRLGLALPEPPLEWPASLATVFGVVGLDDVPFAATPVQAAVGTNAGSGAQAPGAAVTAPVAHRAIPPRRPARELPVLAGLIAGTDYLLQTPAPTAPRLRIHLPKPVLQPYRPRYAFAPRQTAAPEPATPAAAAEAPAAPVAPVETAAPASAPAPEPAKPAGRAESRHHAKSGRKQEAKPEPARTLRPEPVAGPKADRPAGASSANPPAAKPEPAPVEPRLELVPKPEPKPEKKPEPKAELKPEPRPESKAEPKAEPKAESKKEEAKPAPATFAAPSFGGKADVEPEAEGFFSRMPGWQKAAAAIVLIGVAIAAWAVPAYNKSSAAAKAPAVAQAGTTMGADSWETDSSGDTAGIARRRVISLYKPGRAKRNYVFEFTGHVEQRAMGWVFRMKDPRNYYCLKLEHTGNGAGSAVQLVKFAVVNGEEQPHRLVSIAEPIVPGQPVRIRLDVRGQNFSTQVNGRPVDVWIDNQIAEGTVGFSNESGERAVIRTVKVSY